MELSRNEKILKNILGESHELDEPQSRIEALLMQLLEKMSTGDASIITVTGETLVINKKEVN
jgi:hypothetical protein